MDTETAKALSTTMSRFALVIDNSCAGFILTRGQKGYEAYDADEKSLGVFQTEDGATTAVLQNINVTNIST
jgi:hypothetical protein